MCAQNSGPMRDREGLAALTRTKDRLPLAPTRLQWYRLRGAVGMRRSGLSASLAPYAFVGPFLIVFAFAIAAPLAYAVDLTFFQDRLIGGNVFTGLSNYGHALHDPLFWSGAGRVGLFLLIQVPVMLLIATFAAMAIDSGRLRWAKTMRIGIFVPYAIPSVVAALMWGFIYGGQFGLIGQIGRDLHTGSPNLLSSQWMLLSVGNVVTWEFAGYWTVVFSAALQAIPRELYEAAELDGAGEIRKAFDIKLRALRPALLLAATFSIIGSFQLFNEPNILGELSPTAVVTTNYTPNIYAYNLAFNGEQFNYAATVAVMLALLTMIVAWTVLFVTSRRSRTE
jgi:multiple sugar transport system permease protein